MPAGRRGGLALQTYGVLDQFVRRPDGAAAELECPLVKNKVGQLIFEI